MTVEQDGQARAVDYSMNDRLCLDGQRLVATGGTYGSINTTYATEINSFARITQLGGDLNATNSYFKVEYKSGEIAYFGGTSTATNNARAIAGGVTKPLTWMIARTEDRLGNNIVYAYTNFGNGEYLPAAIYYTGFGAAQGDRNIEFSYATRPAGVGINDQSSSYLAGGLTGQTQRLIKIATRVGAELVREYYLNYAAMSASTGRSLLANVHECAWTGSTPSCRRPTTFNWQQAAAGYSLKQLQLNVAGLPDPSLLYRAEEAGDFDGDGLNEYYITYLTNTNPNLPYEHYFVSFDAERNVRGVINVDDTGGYAPSDPLFQKTDFNHDGRTDYITYQTVNNVSQLAVRAWNGSATQWQASSFSTYSLGVPAAGMCSSKQADMNGDGYTDLLVTYFEAPSTGCAASSGYNNLARLKIYLGKAGATIGQPAVDTTPVVDVVMPYATNIIYDQTPATVRPYVTFVIDRIDDFNGDGLPDLFLTRPTDRSESVKPMQVWFSRRGSNGYTLGGAGNVISSFAALSSSALTPDETHINAYHQWLDIDGDGLTDLLGAKRLSDGKGYWSVRLNQGGILGPQIVTSNNRGLENCIDTPSAYHLDTCAQRWKPMFASRFELADINDDGRYEMLVPRAFAARICHVDVYRIQNSEVRQKYYCPEDPITGLKPERPADWSVEEAFASVYGADGKQYPLLQDTFDASAYFMDSISFVQTDPSSIRADVNSTQIIKGGFTTSTDMYNDGLVDQISFMGYPFKPQRAADGTLDHAVSWGPSMLPDGTAVSTLLTGRKLFVSENLGAGPRTGQPGLTRDVISGVTNGMAESLQFNYYPLTSKGGRTSGTPLYSVPLDVASRYIDDRHTYFSAPVQVVSEMQQSNGIGGMNTTRYGYSEAMYNTQGRGFQGFRKIMEEDITSGLRTTTTFSQKYPLTSLVEKVVVNPISQPGETNRISQTDNIWRCNRLNRNDTAACNVTPGSNPVRFVYQSFTEHVTFDLETAAAGLPNKLTGFTADYYADTTSCDGGTIATASGYDENGNITAKTHFKSDYSDGTPGYKNYIALSCNRTRNTYAPADLNDWWLDKLTNTETRNETLHGADQVLPAGVANPVYITNTGFNWNANRTLASETFQDGIAYQRRVTVYSYPSSNNYGLPLSVIVDASGDQNPGGRTTSTTYSPDGYFPLSVTNALGHTATTVVRLRDGLPISVTDPNGLRTLYEYDGFGFTTRIKYRGALDSQYLAPDKQIAMLWCNGGCWRPEIPYIRFEVQDGSPTTADSFWPNGKLYVHHIKHPDGQWEFQANHYDARGLLTDATDPWLSGEEIRWTHYRDFDLLGRMGYKIRLKENSSNTYLITDYIYTGRTTNIIAYENDNPYGPTRLTLSRSADSTGRYVETSDALGGVTKFWFDADGQASVLQDVKGNQIRANYNAIGQRVSVNDPNQGVSYFSYNALGEVLSQTDARNITSYYSYDKLGRKTQLSVTADANGDGNHDAIVDTWTYDPSGAKGQLSQSKRTINGVIERQDNSSFDALIRPHQVTSLQNTGGGTNRSYSSEFQYDTYYGRVLAQFFPNGEGEHFIYSKYGHLTEERNATNASIYRQVVSSNARGQPLRELKGFNLATDTTYWQNGQVKTCVFRSIVTAHFAKP